MNRLLETNVKNLQENCNRFSEEGEGDGGKEKVAGASRQGMVRELTLRTSSSIG